MLPNEEDLLEIYGPCKLHTNLHHHHGICNHCIATLLSTITRNNTIVSAKLEALATHLMVMRAREDEIDKGCYLQLFDKYDQLQEIILKDIAGILSSTSCSFPLLCLSLLISALLCSPQTNDSRSSPSSMTDVVRGIRYINLHLLTRVATMAMVQVTEASVSLLSSS
jgi:hypothetical protein